MRWSPWALLCDPQTGFQHHRPIVGWTLALLLGTVLGFSFGSPLMWLIGATACAPFLFFKRSIFSFFFMCMMLAGWNVALTRIQHECTAERLAYLRMHEHVVFKVAVSENYRIIPRKRSSSYCRFLADRVWLEDGYELQGVNLFVNFYNPKGEFPHPGETWRIDAKVHHSYFPHTVTVSAYADASVFLPEEWHLSSVRLVLGRIRNRLVENITLGMEAHSALRLETMTLGAYKKLPYEEREVYANTGIIHIFSISGLHVGILAGILMWTIAWGGVNSRLRWLFIFPPLLSYLVMTGREPSAVRASLMAMVYIFAPCFMRKPDVCTTYFIVLAGSLILSPEWIQHTGALLSFTVMGGILLYFSPFNYFFNRLFRSHVQRNELGDLPRGIKWHERLRRALASILALTFSAWIASLPLTLHFFARFPMGGLLLNLFVPTFTVVILWLASLSAFVGFLMPIGSIAINSINAFLLDSFIMPAALWMNTQSWCSVTLEATSGKLSSFLLGGIFIFIGVYLRALERACRLNDLRDPLISRIKP